jgi:hypothetical protein
MNSFLNAVPTVPDRVRLLGAIRNCNHTSLNLAQQHFGGALLVYAGLNDKTDLQQASAVRSLYW